MDVDVDWFNLLFTKSESTVQQRPCCCEHYAPQPQLRSQNGGYIPPPEFSPGTHRHLVRTLLCLQKNPRRIIIRQSAALPPILAGKLPMPTPLQITISFSPVSPLDTGTPTGCPLLYDHTTLRHAGGTSAEIGRERTSLAQRVREHYAQRRSGWRYPQACPTAIAHPTAPLRRRRFALGGLIRSLHARMSMHLVLAVHVFGAHAHLSSSHGYARSARSPTCTLGWQRRDVQRRALRCAGSRSTLRRRRTTPILPCPRPWPHPLFQRPHDRRF